MGWNAQIRQLGIQALSYLCVCLFFVLTSHIVFIYYETIITSAWEKKNYKRWFFHMTFGNWIAVNIYFNYIMACITPPGLAKDYQHSATQYPICKKCSMHKPPRTHHCSWCDTCVLKFDHHCPWLDNCVGFYNHRYFFQFCCFMAIGCAYAGTMGYREYQIGILGEQRFSYYDSFFKPFVVLDAFGIYRFITYFIFIATLTISFLLTGLICWHGRMISRGITSVERLLHQDYAEQSVEQGFVFINPYDFGLVENWKRFFNVRTVGEFIRRVLLPSIHKPSGNGIIWPGCDVHSYSQSHRYDPGLSAHLLAFPPEAHLNSARAYPNNRDGSDVLPRNKQTKSTSHTRTNSKSNIQSKKPVQSKKNL